MRKTFWLSSSLAAALWIPALSVLGGLVLLCIVLPVTAQGADNFFQVCAKGTVADIRRALDAGAKINAKDNKGMTALMYAAKDNIHPEVITVLLEAADEFNRKRPWYKLGKKVDINDVDREGKTALMYAAESNSLDMVQVLLKAGAKVNAKDGQKKTALMYAAKRKCSPEVVKILLDAGADTKARDRKDRTALIWAETEKSCPEVVSLLQNPDDKFLRLCAEGTSEEIRTALKAGANINAKDKDGMTVLMTYAARDDADPTMMEDLLKAAAEFNKKGLWKKGKSILGLKTVDVNGANREGKTALMFAAEEKCNPKMVVVLLKAGADINAMDQTGKTALTRLEENKFCQKSTPAVPDTPTNIKPEPTPVVPGAPTQEDICKSLCAAMEWPNPEKCVEALCKRH